MSWNGLSPNPPNWSGQVNTGGGGSDVGDLYITPDPPNTSSNPSIGLEERNEIPLPRAYQDFAVQDLTVTNINGNPNFDASKWSLYRAISDVRGTLGAFSLPLYSISDFLNITAANSITAQAGSMTAGVQVSAPVGNFTFLNVAEDINVSSSNETADVNIYGANLLAGDNALFVEGGTTLTGGGIVHGTTIGALRDPVGGVIDLVRIDVLPAGMLLTSATFITITSVGATAVSGAGTLALAGGDYITYNSDEHRFINTTSGNDATNILVGAIQPAFTGALNLRINGGGSGRGVELADVKSLALWTELPIANWLGTTLYTPGNKVKEGVVYYNCLVTNFSLIPNAPIPDWVSGTVYDSGQVVFEPGYSVFRANTFITTPTLEPHLSSEWDDLTFTTNAITNIWAVYTPFVSNITGDDVSNITIGNITPPVDFTRIGGSGLQGKTQFEGLSGFNYLELVAQTGSANTIAFLNSAAQLQAAISSNNVDGRLLIQSDTGLTINTTGGTTTSFNNGLVNNLKTLTLTTDLKPLWAENTIYPLNAIVEYNLQNWRSEIADNRGNIPQALLTDWTSGSDYVVGNVRYDTIANKSYLCTADISGSTTRPELDTANWSFFQVGSNGEDVFYPLGAVVSSEILGDRNSGITIGQAEFRNDTGGYLTISSPDQTTSDAIILSPGTIAVVGTTGVTFGATAGDVTIQSGTGEVLIGGETNVNIGADTGDVVIIASTGNVELEGDTITATAELGVVITSTTADINLTSELGTNITSGDSLVLTSLELTNITSTASSVNIDATTEVNIVANEDLNLTSSTGAISLNASGNINLSSATGLIVANKGVTMTNNNITNANTITGQTALTLATLSGANLNLSPDAGGLIVANRGLNLNNNNVTNANTITGQTALSLASTNGQVNLTAGGTGNRINFNSDAQFNNRTLFNFTGTNVGGIFGLTSQPLNLVGNQTIPAVTIRGSLTMWATASVQAPGNSISGVTTLNGRNLFSYGNFWNTATQTLGAINTATRIQMNTSANNNNITLDTTTNIGRLTFTNAGVYQVSWSAYLFHGSGGTAKSVIWIRLNGSDVAGSGKTENNDSQQNETNLASTSLVSVTANQYIEFYWASDSVNVPITAVAASAPYPATPSFACSIQIVG